MTVTQVAHPDWEALLHAQQRRVTKQRLTVLSVIHSAPHQDAEEIWRAALKTLPLLSLQSVYTVLGDLVDLGIVRKIDLGLSPARYETRTGDNHHHAVCSRCQVVEDIDCLQGMTPCLEPVASTMTITHANIVFSGICHNCRASTLTTENPNLKENHDTSIN